MTLILRNERESFFLFFKYLDKHAKHRWRTEKSFLQKYELAFLKFLLLIFLNSDTDESA
jgi:hypothetical protein